MEVQFNREQIPFITILPIVLVGILLGEAIDLSWIVAAVGVAISAVMLLLFSNRRYIKEVYGVLLILCSALTMTDLRAVESRLPHDTPLEVVMEIRDNPSTTSGGYLRTTAHITAYRGSGDEGWAKTREKLFIITPPSTPLALGKVYRAALRVNEIASEGWENYARLMHRRGYTGSAFVGEEAVAEIAGESVSPLLTFGARNQSAAQQTLSKLGLEPQAMAITEAMTIGVRDNIAPELRDSYAQSGASHLLAVSGLHVGIVVLLVNTLLRPLLLVRGGHRWRNLIAMAAIWLYTVLTGCAPSTVRAAFMFSGAMYASTQSLNRNPINILLATATVMLLWNPNTLYDISFQMSFMAVLGIALLYRPIYEFGKSSYRATNALWSSTSVAIAATLMTAPILAHTFGLLPIAGVLISPLLVLAAYIVVSVSLMWLILPTDWLAEVCSYVIGGVASLQNRIVEISAEQWWISAEVSLPDWAAIAIYIGLIVGFIVYYTIRQTSKTKQQAV